MLRKEMETLHRHATQEQDDFLSTREHGWEHGWELCHASFALSNTEQTGRQRALLLGEPTLMEALGFARASQKS